MLSLPDSCFHWIGYCHFLWNAVFCCLLSMLTLFAGSLQRFQHQLAAKHQAFYSATRLGRNLKDRCTKADPERDVLQQMLDELKNKWNAVRSVVSRRWVAWSTRTHTLSLQPNVLQVSVSSKWSTDYVPVYSHRNGFLPIVSIRAVLIWHCKL